jgi:hypothetical protein
MKLNTPEVEIEREESVSEIFANLLRREDGFFMQILKEDDTLTKEQREELSLLALVTQNAVQEIEAYLAERKAVLN